MGDYIYVVQLDIPAEHEDDFNTVIVPLMRNNPGLFEGAIGGPRAGGAAGGAGGAPGLQFRE